MRLSISLDDDLYAAVKSVARAEGLSLSAAVNSLLRRSIFPVGQAVPVPSVRNGLAVVDGRVPLSSEDVRRMEEQLDQEYGSHR
jgi:antitoxin component of RelBE/YafQ-DinJ toxin-antitoxin module